ncbi:MAG TPA: hypothetical protein VFW42_01775 [Fluviicoccus sp.]|nr:hypothetical protein [Fluviicoccus sp.]
MYKQLLKLPLLVVLLMGSPVHADSLCGSNTSSEPVEAMGKDVWLDGYCKGFLPCRLAYEQFHGCQAAESFLSNLGAKEGQPLTEAQVEEALVRTKRTASASTPRMAKISATSERDRVAALDSSTAAALQSDCTERACMNYHEKQLNLLTGEVEKLNSNADILYWLPEYAPVQAFMAAERLGWKRQDGQWVFSAARVAPVKESVTTPGQYLLSVAECQKLYEKLDQEIKATPGKQPDNLSFFEAECVPQVSGYAENVKSWHASLSARSVTAKPAMTSGDNASPADRDGSLPDSRKVTVAVPPDAGLQQWNEELVSAERQRETEMAAAAAAKQRVEEERKRAVAEAARQQEVARAEAERKAAREGWVLPSDCQAEQAAVRQHQDIDGTGNTTEQSITDALRRPWVYRWEGKNGETTAAELLEREKGYLHEVAEKEEHIAKCRLATGLGRIMCPTEETSDIRMYRLTACAYRVAATRRGGNASSSATPSSSSDAACEVKLKAIDDQVGAAVPRCGESATCNLQVAMWGLTGHINTIESDCPNGKFAARLSDARSQLERVTATCNQIASGGHCSPKL